MKKLIYALLSVVVAFGLWLYVITTVSPEWEETFYNIPVVLKNDTVLPERGLMIEAEELPKVTLRLRGNRSDLINLTSDNILITADMAGIYSAGVQNISYTITYPGNVPSNAIEVISKSPATIQLTIKERATVQLPVQVDFGGTTVPEGYLTDKENQLLSPGSVSVTGPKDLVDSIAHAKIHVDLTGKTETITGDYPVVLYDADGNEISSKALTLDVQSVEYTLKIQRYKQLELKLDILPGGGANADNTVITMDMPSITVSGSDKALNALGDVLVLGEIRLGEIDEDTVLEFDIKLPEGVENRTGKNTVSVSITLAQLVTQTFTVTDITALNVPAGLAVEISAKQLNVTVRGTAQQMALLTAEDISVTVDFSKAEVGGNTYRVQVLFNEAFTDVGVMDSYTVFATVTERQEKEDINGTNGTGDQAA